MLISFQRIVLVLLLAGGTTTVLAQRPAHIRGANDWRTDWSKTTIDTNELMSGGVPRDGIPAIHRPNFDNVIDAQDWLKPQEPIVALEVQGEARGYPLQILTWHEIVNDEVAGQPITVTFCPLCYSAIAFDRRVNGQALDFGVSGLLRNSDMVMYDHQTETLWQQFVGEGIVGELAGVKLEMLPAQIISFEQFAEAYPNALVLNTDTGQRRPYGQNPYVGYDDIKKKPFLFRGETDGRLRPMEKVIALHMEGNTRAYPYAITRKKRVIHDEANGEPIVVFHAKGATSALDQSSISDSKEAGSTGVFDPRVNGQTLTFTYKEGRFVDDQTGSTWDITGRAIEGMMRGQQLKRHVHGDYFAFAWFAFRPETELYKD